jgi:hypothetical protein
MEGLKMKTLKNYIIDETIWNLKEREGETVYACDLAYTVFEGANVDGSYTYSTYEAVKWIKKYFDSLGEIVEEMQGQGLNAPNPFDEPEKFQVCVLLEGAQYLLSKCETVDKNWNEEIELTPKTIRKICRELREQKQKYDNGFYN